VTELAILQQLFKSIEVRGLQQTSLLLKVDEPLQIEPELNDFEKFVLYEVTNAFRITIDDLFYKRYQRGNYKYILGMCVHYLYNVTTLGEIQKRIFKTKNKSLLSKYRLEIIEMKPDTPENKNYLKIKKDLDKKIERYNLNNNK
jgi:hypothetical protein